MPAEPFPDNWTYLKTELAWLDRLLSLAVAQQRKDTKEVNQLARSTADRVTSHWWKGLVTLEGEISSDSPVDMPRRKSTAKGSHQQQMAARILASQQQGIVLGIPLLSDRLQLTPFERTLVLLALAPEINRRYGRLYNYLQNIEQSNAPGLPTVDLILRLCCRTEVEWRSARQCFTTSPLIHHHLLELPSTQQESLLTRPVKLCDALVTYLLSEQPAASRLDTLLPSSLCLLHTQDPAPASPTPWASLVLPPSLLMAFQHLCHRVHTAAHVDRALGSSTAGSIALLVGAAGTGKTAAADAIAQALQTPLVWVDLALVHPADHPRLLAEILHQDP
ncbi:hypothetical protein H6F43_14490, partial [Leptolyngbya sp. FACHB-36]|uniref:hypothetical protein n=1 Tax=Leptolyngbya sp. FACHB-36 TaxID=2692808 RepID=UPI0016804011